ncbi:MAG: hypothetical protein S4CHLAM102_13930 [Chlamydiia bacterium]|nr:hypothetical protein [Chlamydiia bacterium]
MPITLGRSRTYSEAFPTNLTAHFQSVNEEWVEAEKPLLKQGELESITFSACGISREIFQKVVEETDWSSVRSLSFYDCLIGPEWGDSLARFIKCHPNVQLVLEGNALKEGVRPLGKEMFQRQLSVNLSDTRAKGTMLKEALAPLHQSPTSTLDFSRNPQSEDEDIPAILQLANQFTNLTNLIFHYIGGTDCVAFKINEMLTSTNVMFVGLDNNRIGPSGADQLVQFVESCPNRSVSVEFNPIQKGAITLGPLLMERASSVNLRGCELTGEIMVQFAARVVQKPSLAYVAKRLKLSHNQLMDVGGFAASKILDYISGLELEMKECRLNRSAQEIFGLLAPYQHTIDFSVNSICDEVVEEMWTSHMSVEKRVQTLVLTLNPLTAVALGDLARLLFCNPQTKAIDLTYLNFAHNPTQDPDVDLYLAQLIDELAKRGPTIDFSGTTFTPRQIAIIGKTLLATPNQVKKLYLEEIPDTWDGQPIASYFPPTIEMIERI